MKLWCKFPEDGGKLRTIRKLSNRRNTQIVEFASYVYWTVHHCDN